MPPSSNGSRNDEDDEGSLELDMDEVMINGSTSGNPQREGRSVSSTVHDRGGKANASKPSPAAPGVNHNPSHAHRANHHSERSSSKRHEAPSASTSGQPQSGARDSFLNYFFGGQPGSENAGPSSVLGGMDGASGQFRAGGNGGRTDYLPDLSKVSRIESSFFLPCTDFLLDRSYVQRERVDLLEGEDWKEVVRLST